MRYDLFFWRDKQRHGPRKTINRISV
jgi:hypothetical protein